MVIVPRRRHSTASTRHDSTGLAVDQHRARAALAELAAVFGAGQLEVLAQALRAASCSRRRATSTGSSLTVQVSRVFMTGVPVSLDSTRANDRQRAPGGRRAAGDTPHQESRDDVADRRRAVSGAFRPEPRDGPVHRAEHGARDDGRVHVDELAGSDAVGDQPAQRLFVAIALLDDRGRAAPAAATRSADARWRPRCRRAACAGAW